MKRKQLALFRLAIFFLCTSLFLAGENNAATDKPVLAYLYGTVSNDEGGIKGYQVIVYRLASDSGRSVLTNACSSLTDLDGRYQCDGLSPGEYLVIAIDTGVHDHPSPNGTPIFTFYGGTGDLSRSTLLKLRFGDSQSADFLISNRPSYSISVRVPGVGPKADVAIYSISDSGLECPISVRAHRDGNLFLFAGVPPGRFAVKAQWSEVDRNMTAATEVEVTTHDLSDIVLQPRGSSEIQVALKASGAAEGAFAKHPDISELSFEEIHTGVRVEGMRDRVNASVYHFPKMEPGEYLLSLKGTETACIDSIFSLGRELRNPTKLDGHQPQVNIDAMVQPACGTVQGVLSPSKTGELVITSDRFEVIRTVESDANGNFNIQGLPDGQYRIYSWPSLKEITYRSLRLLEGLRDHSAVIDISDKEQVIGIEVSPINAIDAIGIE